MIRAGLATLAALAAAGCRSAPAEAGQVDHVVLMWLREPGDEAALARLEAAGRGFVGRIPGLTRVSVGRPLLDAGPLVDDSFDLGFVMNFVDRAALAAYDQHPVHLAAVEQLLAPYVERVQVYDVLLR